MLKRQELSLEISDKAMDFLADLGYDPQFGARPMKRVLQKEIVDHLSKLVIGGKFVAGDTIFVELEGDNLSFKNKKSGKTAAKAAIITKKKPAKSKADVAAAKRKKQLKDLEKATKEVQDATKAATPKKEEKK